MTQINKLNQIKHKVIPYLFSKVQFNVLLKRAKGECLSQTERNYLSNAIKSKIKAINSVQHLKLTSLLRQKKILVEPLINAYSLAGIELIGCHIHKSRRLNATDVVKTILEKYHDFDARIVDLLPVYIKKNIDNIDLFDIYEFAVKNQLVNFTGYIFDIVNFYFPRPELRKFLDSLKKRRENAAVVKDTDYEKIKDLIVQDEISRKWNIYTLNKISDYKRYFELYT